MVFWNNEKSLKIDLSGSTVWPQASFYEKLVKLAIFWHFLIDFCLRKMYARYARHVKNETFFAIFKLDVFCHLLGT